MPDLVPTRATAMLGVKGEFLYAFAGVKYEPGKEAEGYATCLILPAPRPIAECPPEWMDGRAVLIEVGQGWISAAWDGIGWMDFIGHRWPRANPTRIMLPPLSPEEVNR